jgi:hypothetical protein
MLRLEVYVAVQQEKLFIANHQIDLNQQTVGPKPSTHITASHSTRSIIVLVRFYTFYYGSFNLTIFRMRYLLKIDPLTDKCN